MQRASFRKRSIERYEVRYLKSQLITETQHVSYSYAKETSKHSAKFKKLIFQQFSIEKKNRGFRTDGTQPISSPEIHSKKIIFCFFHSKKLVICECTATFKFIQNFPFSVFSFLIFSLWKKKKNSNFWMDRTYAICSIPIHSKNWRNFKNNSIFIGLMIFH